MSASLAAKPEPESPALAAITISRDVQTFDLLIEDMDGELGEGWGDLSFAEAADFLAQPEARAMRFVVVAVDAGDEGDLGAITAVVRQAKRLGLRIILVADGLGPLVMHELLRAGVDDFAPYPLPEGALRAAVARAKAPRAAAMPEMARRAAEHAAPPPPAADTPPEGGDGPGPSQVHAFQSVAGGAGATTLAVNLAWEIALGAKDGGRTVCVLDLDLQFGAVAAYMDLPRNEAIYEILTDTAAMDEQAFRQAMQVVRDRIHVFTAPKELLPLDLIGPEDVSALIALARRCFDVVIVDLPGTLTQWTDTVLEEADVFHAVLTMEVRAAQNALRLTRLLETEGIPHANMRWILNRAPGRGEFGGRGRVKAVAESLGIAFEAVLPDGGKIVTESNDQALPLMQTAARTPLRREIARLAATLRDAAPRVVEADEPKGRSFLGLRFG